MPILFVLCSVLSISALSAQEAMPVDVVASRVTWSASKVAGSHTGNVGLDKAVLTVQKGMLLSADVSMNMTSISCTDLSSEKSNARLVSHLKGEDFFDVADHPLAHFRTTSVEYKGKVDAKSSYRVEGILTIKGIEAPNTFDVQFWTEGKKQRATGSIRFDRTVYGIRYGSGSFFEGLGDGMIKDEVDLDFDLRTK